ncbi:carboxymuconolactone decarboxylase family protein [Arthrobacter sp. zg-Y820]|uniref:carboxymuconolactone decarboxylase family protein n=1 Tax=Arthrobacter sp. zg-Y820 TaxID=2894192 RepID=UPI0022B1F7CC|nr:MULTISPECIES: carboxymuconolactone decarboxylase family protein [unclassified Arthrobacter]MDK1279826.1 carboxymuconolactone decarboxylase family protein [Arthrobacter sp. zg.Y820]WIB11115.1 carboxymuconolactone decarboxylase family protein [Arthrobacter sp. zg-Y820]
MRLGAQLGAVREVVATTARENEVPLGVVEQMNLRISQLNGCAFCVHVHHRRALRAGVPAEQLAQLPVWRETPRFNAVERAALLVGETITLLPEPSIRDRDLLAALAVLSEGAFAAIEWSAILINTYNRLSIASHHPVPGAKRPLSHQQEQP